ANLASASPAATSTDVSGITTNINLGANSAKTYFLLTAITNGIESKTNGTQTVATAHPLEFIAVAGDSTATSTIWMDRNLGAERVATSAADADGFGGLYQFGRPTDGHQLRNSGKTATRASNISPNHADFITKSTVGDWLAAGVDNNGAIRAAIWSSTDGSGICPTGFRVPLIAELEAEAAAWTPQDDPAGAFNSSLKLPTAGFRLHSGSVIPRFVYKSASIEPVQNTFNLISLYYSNPDIERSASAFNYGQAVRCIQN
ncbi:MAG: hypothetical protein HAW58_06425, partial [Candidatus Thioglobus sp.]|nr:hypothetical protein [Candidatus Thioglobus sp.]